MRLDRFITVSLAHPLGRAACGLRMLARPSPVAGGSLPVLMYHSISNDLEADVHPYFRLATAPARFAEQMKWLTELGCVGVSLEEALSPAAGGRCSPLHPVAITFDDGFRDFYTTAWPVLKRHGFTATVYLPTAHISEQRQKFRGKECLTWSEVRELRAQGVRFGSHTVNHTELYRLPWAEIEKELALSKDLIEQELEVEVPGFAYPYAFPQEAGRFTQLLTTALRRQGYRYCATTVLGRVRPSDDPFRLKRLPVNSCDDQALFAAKLGGAYDWLGLAQRVFRSGKIWIKPGYRRVDEPHTASVELHAQS